MACLKISRGVRLRPQNRLQQLFLSVHPNNRSEETDRNECECHRLQFAAVSIRSCCHCVAVVHLLSKSNRLIIRTYGVCHQQPMQLRHVRPPVGQWGWTPSPWILNQNRPIVCKIGNAICSKWWKKSLRHYFICLLCDLYKETPAHRYKDSDNQLKNHDIDL